MFWSAVCFVFSLYMNSCLSLLSSCSCVVAEGPPCSNRRAAATPTSIYGPDRSSSPTSQTLPTLPSGGLARDLEPSFLFLLQLFEISKTEYNENKYRIHHQDIHRCVACLDTSVVLEVHSTYDIIDTSVMHEESEERSRRHPS